MAAIRFQKNSSIDEVAAYLAKTIAAHLAANELVFWLVTGGSAIAVAVKSARLLPKNGLERLTVTLTDERYGHPGHENSNWQQLQDAGFNFTGAKLEPVLKNRNLEETTSYFDNLLKDSLGIADYRLGLFGIGADGHTSGILPESIGVDSQEMAVSYAAADYGQRITTTGAAIARLDEAIVYCVGDSKKEPLDNLQKELLPSIQPAQLLKKVNKLTIFNDYIGS